jgi:hypothetical protein
MVLIRAPGEARAMSIRMPLNLDGDFVYIKKNIARSKTIARAAACCPGGVSLMIFLTN